ncbi:MAG TPA: M48 family metalloprotease [Humisphaera sp.]
MTRPDPLTAATRARRLYARLGVVGRTVAVVTLVSAGLLGSVGCQATNDKQVKLQADQFHTELSKAVVTPAIDAPMANYIQTVGDRIVTKAAQLDRTNWASKVEGGKDGEDRSWMFDTNRMKFHFVNSKTLNAFTTGGEHMYVYTKLLQMAKTEDELAAVMSHEYAHVYARHVQKGTSRQTWAMLAAGVGGAAGFLAGGKDAGMEYAGTGAGLGRAVAGVANAGFTRDDETQADRLGFDIYVRAGWDPDQFASFFRTLMVEEQKRGGAGPEWMSDHPSSARRVENIGRWVAEYKKDHPDWQSRRRPPVATQAQFDDVKQRSVAVATRLPDDSSLTGSALAALPRSCMLPDEPSPADAKQAQARLATVAEQMKATDPNAQAADPNRPRKKNKN